MPESSPALVTVPNVEIVAVGEDWPASTGPVTITEDDLRAAIAALDDPAVKTPKLKLGHLDPRFTPDESDPSWDPTDKTWSNIFDGTPALGKYVNLRLANNAQSIVADIVGVPKWLADIMPTAYSSRSIEGWWDVKTSTGHTHQFVISACVLLGIYGPAIETLEDLQVLFSPDGPDGISMVEGERVAAIQGGEMPRRIAASVAIEDVRRSFYETVAIDDKFWWWITQVYADPPLLIVDDDEGHLWAVTYAIKGNDVTFGEPVEVDTQYVDSDSGKVVANETKPERVFASRADSRPEQHEEVVMDPKVIRERLGLAEDATEEDVLAKLDELKADKPEPETTEPEGDKPEEPEAEADKPEADAEPEKVDEPEPVAASGTRTVDSGAWDELQRQAKAGAEARERQVEDERERLLNDAVKAGKFPPARKDHWRTLLKQDEEGTKQVIASLAEGLIPVDERGTAPSAETTAEQYPSDWLSPAELARAKGPDNHRVTQEA